MITHRFTISYENADEREYDPERDSTYSLESAKSMAQLDLVGTHGIKDDLTWTWDEVAGAWRADVFGRKGGVHYYITQEPVEDSPFPAA